MTEIPEHLRKRAEQARIAAAEQVLADERATWRPLPPKSTIETVEGHQVYTTVGQVREILDLFADEVALEHPISVDLTSIHRDFTLRLREVDE